MQQKCSYYEYCKCQNDGKDNFICYNPPYCLVEICDVYRPSFKNNHKVELFKPSEEMVKEVLAVKKKRRKRKG